MADIQAINPIMNGVFWASVIAAIALPITSRNKDVSLGLGLAAAIGGIALGIVLHLLPLEGARLSFSQASVAWAWSYFLFGAILILFHWPVIISTLIEPEKSDPSVRAKMSVPTVVGAVVLTLAFIPLRSAYEFFAPAVLDAHAKGVVAPKPTAEASRPTPNGPTPREAGSSNDEGASYSDTAVTAAAMKAVKWKLSDPASAKFRSVRVYRQGSGTKAVCGEVNAKNRASGYNGYERFVSAGTVEHTWLEQQVSGFESVWEQVCR